MEIKLPDNVINALPILPRADATVWTNVHNARDTIDSAVKKLTQKQINALILKSNDFEFPAWVKIEFWISEGDPLVTERSSAIFWIYPKAFHRYEIEYAIEFDNRGRKKSYKRLHDIDDQDVNQVVRYLIQEGKRPKFVHKEIRQSTWQLWKPANKQVAVGWDWLSVLATTVLVIGIFGIITKNLFGMLFGMPLCLVGGVWLYKLGGRPVQVRTPGKPKQEPRRLRRVDSWQVVISGLGSSYADMKTRFANDLKHPPIDSVRDQFERIWYWGLDSVVEREQIAITLGRGIVFCQIYQYDKELYVGWDGHLNLGQWVEKDLSQGIDKATGQLALVKEVVMGWQNITEYDITDLNCLMEWVHVKLVKSLKELMAEHKIEQEVDFKILRGERQNLTQSMQQTSDTHTRKGLFGNLKRTG